RTHAMAWAATLIGVWTIVTPWCVAGNVHTTRTIVSQCVAGAVAVLCGLIAASTVGGGARSAMGAPRNTRMGMRRNRHMAG
ncbi:MAG: SPW repeat protein, partial [Actinocrinis sp.]